MSSNPNYDSEFCGKVPIHLINTVQPYGVLLILSRTSLEVIQASENASDLFGVPITALVPSPIDRYLDPASLTFLQQIAAGKSTDKIPIEWTITGKKYLAITHVKDTYILVEIELQPYSAAEQRSFVSIYQKIKYSMSLIEGAASIVEACTIAARELRQISGLDKVMIYRFDEQWNGTVIAEYRDEDMESYFGFTFPASDIPRQARDLYLRNPYRFIPDRNYTPVRLYPVINPVTHSFVDLSDCNVRGVVAVHLEYLANMGVTASMSVRILINDQLWGLIACHHKTPKMIPFELCSIFELLSNVLSARIQTLHNKERHDIFLLSQTNYARLIEHVWETGDLQKGLLESDHSVLQLFRAQSAFLVSSTGLAGIGNLPDKNSLDELRLWLHSRQFTRTYHTDHLAGQFDRAAPYSEIASGLLAIPFNPEQEEYILMFREESQKVIEWGGDPGGRIVFEKDGLNYHPRHSFKTWRQIVSGTSRPWREDELSIAETLRTFLYEYANK